MSELMIRVALAKKLCFSYPAESRNAAFSDELHLFSLSFTLSTAGKAWLVTLGLAKYFCSWF